MVQDHLAASKPDRTGPMKIRRSGAQRFGSGEVNRSRGVSLKDSTQIAATVKINRSGRRVDGTAIRECTVKLKRTGIDLNVAAALNGDYKIRCSRARGFEEGASIEELPQISPISVVNRLVRLNVPQRA